jgi:hypothetical protein
MGERFQFSAEIWRWKAREDGWFFVSVPPEQGEAISELPRMPRGFGSVPVRVTVGNSTWTTSIFPDNNSYVLPIKKSVRTAEKIEEPDVIDVEIELR